MNYRKKPVVVQAVQWMGNNWEAIANFHRGDAFTMTSIPDGKGLAALNVSTLEGVMVAMPGDYIIRGVAGEVYPCKPDIFAKTYELVV